MKKLLNNKYSEMIILLLLLFNTAFGAEINQNTVGGNTEDILGQIEQVNKLKNNIPEEKIQGDNKEKEKKPKKKKYSNAPSFLGIGFDLFTFLYNYLTSINDLPNIKKNNYFDSRFKLDTDFNRIIIAIYGGYLKWKIETDDDFERETNAFFINPNVYYNFIKKNSYRNAIYIGGGINFNTTFYEQRSINDTLAEYNSYKNKSFHIWFNIEVGTRIRIIKFLHINTNFRITFLNFNLKNISDKERPDISKTYKLFGFGNIDTSYNVEFCINLIFNIDLKTDDYVTKRESYLYL